MKKFEKYFKISLVDASSECRHHTRLAFLKFREMFPDEAREMYREFDEHAQKAIQEEEGSIKTPPKKCSGDKKKMMSQKFSTKGPKLTDSSIRKNATVKVPKNTEGSKTYTKHSDISSKFDNKNVPKTRRSDTNLEECKIYKKDSATNNSENEISSKSKIRFIKELHQFLRHS